MANDNQYPYGIRNNTSRGDVIEYGGVVYSKVDGSIFWISATGQEILRRMEMEKQGSTVEIRRTFLMV